MYDYDLPEYPHFTDPREIEQVRIRTKDASRWKFIRKKNCYGKMDENKVTINCKRVEKSYLNISDNSKQKDRKFRKIVHHPEKMRFGQTNGWMK